MGLEQAVHLGMGILGAVIGLTVPLALRFGDAIERRVARRVFQPAEEEPASTNAR